MFPSRPRASQWECHYQKWCDSGKEGNIYVDTPPQVYVISATLPLTSRETCCHASKELEKIKSMCPEPAAKAVSI